MKQVGGRQEVTKWFNMSVFMIFPLTYWAEYTVYFSVIYSC